MAFDERCLIMNTSEGLKCFPQFVCIHRIKPTWVVIKQFKHCPKHVISNSRTGHNLIVFDTFINCNNKVAMVFDLISQTKA